MSFRYFKQLFAAAAVILLPASAFAAPYHHPIFNTKKGGSVCYARTYSAAFLKKNPNVKLQSLQLERRNSVADGKPNTAKLFAIAFGASTKAEVWTALAICKPQGKLIACNVESDGGSFTILRSGKGVIIKTRRIQIEGYFKDLEISSKKGTPTRSYTLFGHGTETCEAVFD